MRYRMLGRDLEVSALGLGCMPMAGVGTGLYGHADEAESIATIHRAIDLGVTFFDTAEIYGPYTNEELVGRAIRGRRDGLVIATKFGFLIEDGRKTGVDSSPANIRRACEASLRRLGIEAIDLFYQHRVDPAVPIEDVMGALADLVREGKVRHIGLSEPGADTIRRAHAVHPVTAIQSEYSLWERGVEADILPAIRELGIGFVPYCPLGRGFLTGQLTRLEDIPADDYRRQDPRYAPGNFEANLAFVEVVKTVAARHGVSPARVALAWLLAQGEDIVPIPGAKRRVTMEDSMGAAHLDLTGADLAELANGPVIAGPRYPDEELRGTRL
ncbi:aldo/keto reductase [Allosphingosinicella flava]|uniref:Aldo/keto reductase n=1 Tax=Allosphingosinicella flava TaxID=2771430 RepID=A0A7T2LM41_9SPHN|nr:aldo/keto reductase [Sphingosinicella flava]QPQ55134.1 aldo/keto reductase [Sphingosinicella flava]